MELISAIWDLITATAKGMMKLWGFWICVLPMIIMFLLAIKRSPGAKGKAGEKRVIKTLSNLPEDKYYVLNDVLLITDDHSSQIDHIVVSVYGIFVVETKNLLGNIYGSENMYNWEQNINGNRVSFKNPIHQNYGHIKSLEKVLSGYGDLPIHSVIAFSESAVLHVKTDKTPVIHICEIDSCIKALSTSEVIPEVLVTEIYDTLVDCNVTDKKARQKHIIDATIKKHTYEEKSREGICPRCGGNLVVRYGKGGQFTGCSNYPKCHYTETKRRN